MNANHGGTEEKGRATCEKSAGVREAVGREGLRMPRGLGSLPVIRRMGASSNPLGFLDLDELFARSFPGEAGSWSFGSSAEFSGRPRGCEATESMSVSMSGWELSGGEGVRGGSGKEGDGTGVQAEAAASREGSLGEANVSSAWRVSSEDGETLAPVEMVAATGSTGGFLEGVVTNLMTDGAGFWDFFSASLSAGFSIFIDLRSFLLEAFKELRVNEEYKPECM